MSELWIYIKTNLRANLKQLPNILVVFIGFPIFFSLLMGFSFSSAFIPEQSGDPIELQLINEDQGEYGQLLSDTLSSEEMSQYIEVVEEETNFSLLIQEDYSANLMDTNVVLDTKENASQTEEAMILQVITEFQENLVNQLELSESIQSVENDPEVMNELMNTVEQAASISSSNVFVNQTYESPNALTSNQFTSVSGLIYIFLISLASSVGMKTKEEMKGLRKRINILPLHPGKEILFSIISDSILYVGLGAIYIIIWRLIDTNTFTGNPLFYLSWIAIYILFVQVINNILYHAVSDKYVNVIYQVLTFTFMIFTFLPMDRIMGEQLGRFFSDNIFRQVFNQPMYDYILTQEFTQHIGLAIGLLVASCLIISTLIAWKTRNELKPA